MSATQMNDVARLLASLDALMEIVEGCRGERWASGRARLVDTPEWCELYVRWSKIHFAVNMETSKPNDSTKTEAGLPAPTGSDSRRTPARRALRKLLPESEHLRTEKAKAGSLERAGSAALPEVWMLPRHEVWPERWGAYWLHPDGWYRLVPPND